MTGKRSQECRSRTQNPVSEANERVKYGAENIHFMIKTLRSEPASVLIEYRIGKRTSLLASDFVLHADDGLISLSFDLSSNQKGANGESRRFGDANELMDNLLPVKAFEFGPEKWLSPLIRSVAEFPIASHETAINFIDGSISRYTGTFVRLLTGMQFVVR